VPASSSFIANAHNELYANYTGKGGLFKKKSEPTQQGAGAAAPHRPLSIRQCYRGIRAELHHHLN